ncbi:ankyrin repeat domain-containing protein, partial [Escherichia coli]|nr:ankyrin repeat domain-containing protein [Escherichia coli]
ADRNRSHWSTSKTPSYTKSVSWQHHLNDGGIKQQAIVQLLLEHGASPHLTDKYGKTPLKLARERGFEEIAQLLIAAGA